MFILDTSTECILLIIIMSYSMVSMVPSKTAYYYRENKDAEVVVEQSKKDIIGIELTQLVVDLGSTNFVKWLRVVWNGEFSYFSDVFIKSSLSKFFNQITRITL